MKAVDSKTIELIRDDMKIVLHFEQFETTISFVASTGGSQPVVATIPTSLIADALYSFFTLSD